MHLFSFNSRALFTHHASRQRTMRGWALAACLGAAGLGAPAAWAGHAGAQAPAEPTGRWITANGNLEVEVAPCGAALCGTVTRVLGNKSMSREGQEMTPADARSPMGMQILQHFVRGETTLGDEAVPVGSPGEWHGQIYNREDGKTYRCLMSVSTANRAEGELVLRAYSGLPLLGKTLLWQRADTAAGATRAAGAPVQP